MTHDSDSDSDSSSRVSLPADGGNDDPSDWVDVDGNSRVVNQQDEEGLENFKKGWGSEHKEQRLTSSFYWDQTK